MRTLNLAFLGLIAAAFTATGAWAESAPSPFSDSPATASASGSAASNNQPAAPGASSGSTAKKKSRDRVADAFKLPRGVKLTDKQQAAFDELKATYESAVREALDLIASKDAKERSKGLKEYRETRDAIRKGIKQIVGGPSSGSQQASTYPGSDSSGGSGYATGYAPQGGYPNGYGPPAGGGYPTGGGMMRGGGGGCRGR